MPIGAIIVTIAIFAVPVIIAVVGINAQLKRKRMMYESIVKLVELGKKPEEVKELFVEQKPKPNNNNSVIGFLKGGIVVAGIGVGLAGMGLVLGVSEIYAPAVLMLVLGLSLVIIYSITKPKKKSE